MKKTAQFVSEKNTSDFKDVFMEFQNLVKVKPRPAPRPDPAKDETDGAKAGTGSATEAGAAQDSSTKDQQSAESPANPASSTAGSQASRAVGAASSKTTTKEIAVAVDSDPPGPPVVTMAVLAWIRKMWLSEKHIRINYVTFFLPFVELLHAVRLAEHTTQMQLFEVMDIYANAFELQDRTRASESHKNTSASRRHVLVLEMLDMMKDGVSRHVMDFVAGHVDLLEPAAKLQVLRVIARITRPPFTNVFVEDFRAILDSSKSSLATQNPQDPKGIHRVLRKFASLAPQQLEFVTNVVGRPQ